MPRARGMRAAGCATPTTAPCPSSTSRSRTRWCGPKKGGEFKGDGKKWTKSVWGDQGNGAGLGAGDNIYWKEDELPLEKLKKAFEKKPAQEIAAGEGPRRPARSWWLLTEGDQPTKRVQNAETVLRSLGDWDMIFRAIITCNVLQDYGKSPLNPPGREGAGAT